MSYVTEGIHNITNMKNKHIFTNNVLKKCDVNQWWYRQQKNPIGRIVTATEQDFIAVFVDCVIFDWPWTIQYALEKRKSIFQVHNWLV